jgi:ATP-binding cassette, subfamily B, bacterial PglK
MLQLLRRLWVHTRPKRRRQFGLLFLIMVITSFAEVVSIGAVLPFLSALTAPDILFAHPITQPFAHFLNLTEPKQLILPATIAFAIGAVFSGVMRLILLWLQTRLSYALGADFSFSIYRRTLYQPYSVHVSRNSSEVMAGVRGKADAVVGSILLPAMIIASSTMMLLSIMVVLLTIDPSSALIALIGFGIIYGLIIKFSRNTLLRNSERVNLTSIQVIKALQEGLGGIRDILIDGVQSRYCKIYSDSDLPLRRAKANIIIISGSPRFAIEGLGLVLIAFLAYSLATSPGGIFNAIPVLGALAIGAQRLLPVIQQAYGSWSSIRGAQASLVDALALLDQPLPDYANAPEPSPMPFLHNVSLNNLAFQYSKNTPWVLQHGFSFSFKKGSRIGLIGATGSGKSTLINIVMGLLEPTMGSLAIDGKIITEQNRRGWQAHIAHVPQAIFLADTSIAENIAFGTPVGEIDHARMREAAQKAQIAKSVELMDKKYNTLVGEKGVRLSGGQRQRIGIARALYKQADVIVFDEATSALDNDTERAVMDAIENLSNDLTMIIIAHRLSTLENCTQVLELANGKVLRVGSYDDIVGYPKSIGN